MFPLYGEQYMDIPWKESGCPVDLLVIPRFAL